MSSETSRRVYDTEIGYHVFDQDSPSEITEDFDYCTHASATELLAHINNRESTNPNIYIPP